MLFFGPAVLALALLLMVGISSYCISWMLSGRTGLFVRIASVLLTGYWITAAVFHLLINIAAFNRIGAFIALLGVCIACIACFGPIQRFKTCLKDDYGHLKECWESIRSTPLMLSFVGFFAVLAAMLVIRAELIPLMGHDTVTYHGLKAGLWVGTGQKPLLNGPGCWDYYRLFPGGAEVWLAWSMLPFRSDVGAGGIDALSWLGLGICLVALAQEIGADEHLAILNSMFTLSIPTYRFLVGSGYVEPALNFCLCAAFLFTLRFLRLKRCGDMSLAAAAIGLSAGIKLTAAPIGMMLGIFLLVRLVLRNGRRGGRSKAMVYSAIGLLTPWLPWFAENYRLSGFPLSPLDLRIGSVTLGRKSATVAWLQRKFVPPPYRWSSEKVPLKVITPGPGSYREVPGLLSFAGMAFSVIGWPHLFAINPLAAATLLSSGLACIATYYSPSFSVIRLFWRASSARFLLPLFSIFGPIGTLSPRALPILRAPYIALISLITMYHSVMYAIPYVQPHEGGALFRALCWFALGGLVVYFLSQMKRRSLTVILCTLCATFIGFSCWLQSRWSRERAQLVRSVRVLHPMPTYWAAAAESVDKPRKPRRIAITSGPHQIVDNWFTYFFLGRQFQNHLSYIPISRDGNIRQFGPMDNRAQAADFESWLKRLKQHGISRIMSFQPPSIELQWMESHPQQFRRINGQIGRWGLFRLLE